MGRFPLAVDLADTVRIVGSEDIELLVDDEDLAVWVAAELPRYPVARGALGHLVDVRELRDAVRILLRAHTGEAPLPRRELAVVNAASARSPSFPVVTESGRVNLVEVNDDPFAVFCATVARSTTQVLTDGTRLAACHAPSCGMFFVPGPRRQTWCSPGCGNRARVARHAARTGPTGRLDRE